MCRRREVGSTQANALFVRILPALWGNLLSVWSGHQKKILHGLACVFKIILRMMHSKKTFENSALSIVKMSD